MKNTIKGGLYATAGYSLSALNSVAASNSSDPSGFFWGGQDKITVGWESAPLETAVQSYVSTFMTFLAIVAVLLILWGGFNILTAAGDDDKVSKGKTIIIQAGIGLVVIFLANSIIQWVLGLLV